MGKRNSIFIIDSDNEYRQELISHFATSIEDFKLCGVKNLDEMDMLYAKGFLRKNKNYLVISDQQFDNNKHSLFNVMETYSKPHNVYKIIVYSALSEEMQKKDELSKFKKFLPIPRNDFSFYRIQNVIRTSVNHSDYFKALIGFIISLSVFAVLSLWFYLI